MQLLAECFLFFDGVVFGVLMVSAVGSIFFPEVGEPVAGGGREE